MSKLFKIVAKIYILITAGLFLTPLTIISQEDYAVFDHLTVDDGLSNSLVFQMSQDSLGFIWIATQDGLNKFDGYNFKTFRGDDSIRIVYDNWTTCVTTDKSGNIWYGTRMAGIGKINSRTGESVSYKERLLHEFGETSLNIQNLFITSDDKILIATWGSGLLIYDMTDSTFTQYLHEDDNPNTISENRIYSVYKDSKGNIWAGAQRTGLNKINVSSDKVTHYDFLSDDPDIISNNFVLTVMEDHLGDIWAGTFSNGLYRINSNTGEVHQFGVNENMSGIRISFIFEDSDKTVWVSSNGNGLFKYVREQNKFINYRNKPDDERSLNRNKVWSIMEDRNGLLWFGTLTNGINIYDHSKNQFGILTHNPDNPESIISSYIKGILIDRKDNLWLGTPEGVSIISPDGSVKQITRESGLSINHSRAFYERSNGEIWIGTWGGGISIYNPANGKFKYLKNDPNDTNSLADNYLKCILEKDNLIYIGTERGLSQYDPETGRFKTYIPIKNDTTSLSHSQITNIYVDSKNSIWVGTNGGLNIFDAGTGKFNRIKIRDSGKIPQRKRIRNIYEDSHGNIWIGTLGAGLAKYIPEENDFKFYTQKDGLSNNSVYEILEDSEGNLWISTNFGLNRFDPVAERFSVYRSGDGLPNDEFNSGAALKGKDGILYYGGVEGLTYFDPAKLISNKSVPEIAITRITINGEDYNPAGFYENIASIELPHDKNFVNIYFSALDYSDPEGNSYKYKLEGVNDDWIVPENGNVAVFTNLDPGNYFFHVKGSNKYGTWNNVGKTVSITINHPWWSTVIARISYVVLFILIILGIYKLRVRQIQTRQALLERLVDERTTDLQESKKLLEEAVTAKDKLFSIIAHDLKNPFVALLGYSEMLNDSNISLTEEERKESVQYIYDASRSFYSLLQNLLDWARLQLNTIECSLVKSDAKQIIDDVLRIYNTTATVKSVKLLNNIESETYIYADENMSHAIFRNLISNSIKFTESNGTVQVSAFEQNGNVNIVIEDDGIGMNKTTLEQLQRTHGIQASTDGTSHEKGTGLGIMLAREFIIKNNGFIELSSQPGQGTKIVVGLKKYIPASSN